MAVARNASRKLRGDAEFRRVVREGRRAGGNLLTVHILPGQAETRAGFIASRTIGGAVERNRARRALREAWRAVKSLVPAGTHVVLVSRPGIEAAGASVVEAEMKALLRRLRVLRE